MDEEVKEAARGMASLLPMVLILLGVVVLLASVIAHVVVPFIEALLP